MDVRYSWREFSTIMGHMFAYGCLWIHMDQLEAVRDVMGRKNQDTWAITRDLNLGYAQMGSLHNQIQARLQPFNLRLGVSPDQTRLVIDSEMD